MQYVRLLNYATGISEKDWLAEELAGHSAQLPLAHSLIFILLLDIVRTTYNEIV